MADTVDPTSGSRRARRWLRLIARCVVLAAAVVLALPVVPWGWAPLVVPAVSPFVALGSALATRSLSWTVLLGLPVLVLALARARWFCRQACPVGLMLEQVQRLRPKVRSRAAAARGERWQVCPPRANCPPTRRGAGRRLPPLGQWVVLLTVGGAAVGYPLLLWLDPLALLSGFFTAWQQPVGKLGMLAGVGLPAVLLLGVLWPNAWCGRLCPLGAAQDLLTALRRLVRPRKAAEPAPSRWPLARRTVLAAGLGAAGAAATLRWARGGDKPIRPPGAIDEARFAGVCVRCGNCVRACPTKVIEPDLGRHGLAALLTPVLCFDEAYCQTDCIRCGEVCPSGAIARLSRQAKERTAIGIAKVDMLACFLSQYIECGACAGACPYQAITIDFNEADYSSTIGIDAAACTGCGACEAVCTTAPKKAIRVYPLA